MVLLNLCGASVLESFASSFCDDMHTKDVTEVVMTVILFLENFIGSLDAKRHIIERIRIP